MIDYGGHKEIAVLNYRAFRRALLDAGNTSLYLPERFNSLDESFRMAFFQGAEAVFNQVYSVPVGMDAASMAEAIEEREEADAREEKEERECEQ